MIKQPCACRTWCGDINCQGLAIPDFARLTKEERAAGWRNRPPPPAPFGLERPRIEDPSTTAVRIEVEAERKAKSRERIEVLLANKATRGGRVKPQRVGQK